MLFDKNSTILYNMIKTNLEFIFIYFILSQFDNKILCRRSGPKSNVVNHW